jgi:hypothetical protein
MPDSHADDLITPDDPRFEGVELSADEIYALMVDEAEWMRDGEWRWSKWTQLLASEHHPPRDPEQLWDHDHCHFCHKNAFSAIYEGDLREGWTAERFPSLNGVDHQEAGYYWVCPDCFTRLRGRFGWRIVTT